MNDPSNGLIKIIGAHHNNLKGWDLDLPVGQWIAVTGVSGSGKSSLAMDVLYAEGQRRYVETFSPYARQFLERMDRPHVKEILGIPPALAIESTHPVRTSRSTVGTLTELTDLLKLLFSRMAHPFCPFCNLEIRGYLPDQLWEELRACSKPGPWIICFPFRLPHNDLDEIRHGLLRLGFFRIWDGGGIQRMENWKQGPDKGEIEVIVDRFHHGPESRSRFVDSAETAFKYGKGEMLIHFADGTQGRWNNQWKCNQCGYEARGPSSNLFSFNSPSGACPTCRGFGRLIDIDPDLIIPDPSKSIREGALRPFAVRAAAGEFQDLLAFCRSEKIPLDVPWNQLAEVDRQAIVDGKNGFYGVRGFFRWLEEKTYKLHVRVFLSRFRAYVPCTDCNGARLRPEALLWRLSGKTLPEVWGMDVEASLNFFRDFRQSCGENPVVYLIVGEIEQRLQYLHDVGLGYLTLDRPSRTLSGGEVERVLLTRALGSRLANTLFVLDEPSIGLHARDTERLVRVIRNLVRQGNTAVIVEHDPEIIRHSDRVVDLGPGAGKQGGQVVFSGPPSRLAMAKRSLTGQYLTGRKAIPIPRRRRPARPERSIQLRGVQENNLRNIDVGIPVGLLVCITGVSGSGKSTLILEVLHRALIRELGIPGERPGKYENLEGIQWIDRVELVDQSALGRSPRANAATYTKAWESIRRIFASTTDARKLGWQPRDFSFNVSGGRCESCRGEGFLRVEMQFLSDVLLRCPECQGRRFRGEILQVRFRGRSISEVLEMTVKEAMTFFSDSTRVVKALQPLKKMGLGYLTLGQPLSTLSGGEAQRLKLARYLNESSRATLFLLDEPTTGLHLHDVKTLLKVLNGLIHRGHSVVVVEHHMEVIKCADHIIDLGPEGGEAGGRIVVEGTPEEIAACPQSHTGRYLQTVLQKKSPCGTSESSEAPRVSETHAPVNPSIQVIGAREHNLKNLSISIPREKMVVITGVSGSGKSTLAFDILFAEGQRRYLESLPAYVRQYLRILDRPDVDMVSGIPPTVAIEQRAAQAGRRSTVATLTEIYHFLRLLFSRLGTQYCPRCKIPISEGGLEAIVSAIMNHFRGQRISVLAPKVIGRKGFHRQILERARKLGLQRVRLDGSFRSMEVLPELDRYREHWVDWVLGEDIEVRPEHETDVLTLLDAAISEGSGTAVVCTASGQERTYSRRSQCPRCGAGYDELDPRHFSFNSAMGACPRCEGFGWVENGDRWILCDQCKGERLNPRARAVKLLDLNISQMTAKGVSEARHYWIDIQFPETWQPVSQPIVTEILVRLETLERLGLAYLTLDRPAHTLSGGESQRIRLAAQIGSNLRGACYVLDEPTIGLHPRDQQRLMESLRSLRDRGNTVIVVEHDEETIRESDWILDLGPGAGRDGGELVAAGAWGTLVNCQTSPTIEAIKEDSRRKITSRGRKPFRDHWIHVGGVSHNNLKDIHVAFPIGTLTCVTGVSGSGKSSLVQDVLYLGLKGLLSKERETPEGCLEIRGWEVLERVLDVDHSPIGRTPRSTPATYVKLWDEIRKLYALIPEARTRGYTPGRFSFNLSEGRCEVCQGQGIIRQKMNFLPDVYVSCEVCQGTRFNRETLSVQYRGKHIGDVIQMTIEEALYFFEPIPRVRRPLRIFCELGLGYLTLGQPSPTLSGGESQRLKLAQELSKNSRGKTLYVLDEPTTGLHLKDVQYLLDVLHRIVDRGNTVVVIEHHMDVIASADHIIDLGPEGGDEGGWVVTQGHPEEILLAQERSHTARSLKRFLTAYWRS
jgi:excinuclease ABC subunit A